MPEQPAALGPGQCRTCDHFIRHRTTDASALDGFCHRIAFDSADRLARLVLRPGAAGVAFRGPQKIPVLDVGEAFWCSLYERSE